VAKENCVAEFVEFLGPFSREEFSSMPGTYVDCSRKKTCFEFCCIRLRHDFDEPTIPVVKKKFSLINILGDERIQFRRQFMGPKVLLMHEKNSNNFFHINKHLRLLNQV